MKKNRFILLKCTSFVLFILAFIVSTITTYKIYKYINPDNTNNIFSENMLIAIKHLNIPFQKMFQEKFLLRISEIIILTLLLITKFKKKILYGLIVLTGIIIGFYSTIFYLEMGYIGIINYILVSFPHQLFYIAAVICLINLVFNKTSIGYETKKNLLDKLAPFLNISLLWLCGVLSETVINLFLVQKLFIYP